MAPISYAPPLQALFHTAALPAADWAVFVVFRVLLLAANETRKWRLRKHPASARQPGDRPARDHHAGTDGSGCLACLL
jgi:hypothetical protein